MQCIVHIENEAFQAPVASVECFVDERRRASRLSGYIAASLLMTTAQIHVATMTLPSARPWETTGGRASPNATFAWLTDLRRFLEQPCWHPLMAYFA
eukprot:scaffold171769_cov34-Prasinocladus_malaysianus.AAC.2